MIGVRCGWLQPGQLIVLWTTLLIFVFIAGGTNWPPFDDEWTVADADDDDDDDDDEDDGTRLLASIFVLIDTPDDPWLLLIDVVIFCSSGAQHTLKTTFMLFVEQRPPIRRCRSSFDDVAKIGLKI